MARYSTRRRSGTRGRGYRTAAYSKRRSKSVRRATPNRGNQRIVIQVVGAQPAPTGFAVPAAQPRRRQF